MNLTKSKILNFLTDKNLRNLVRDLIDDKQEIEFWKDRGLNQKDREILLDDLILLLGLRLRKEIAKLK